MLSTLQQHILKQCISNKGSIAVDALRGNHKIVRTSIDRLIKKELLVGYGSKTPHKLYLTEIRLTSKGRKAVQGLLPKQQSIFNFVCHPGEGRDPGPN